MTTTERDTTRGGYEAEGGMNPMTKHEELERLARAATPGPWHPTIGHPSGRFYGVHARKDKNSGSVPVVVFRGVARPEGDGIHNAAFIAAANPAAILALLSANREMREALEPFALHAELYDGLLDTFIPANHVADASGPKSTLHLAAFRKARSALTTQRGDGE